jgi:hypothetical protein
MMFYCQMLQFVTACKQLVAHAHDLPGHQRGGASVIAYSTVLQASVVRNTAFMSHTAVHMPLYIMWGRVHAKALCVCHLCWLLPHFAPPPGWELAHNHYVGRLGLAMPETAKLIANNWPDCEWLVGCTATLHPVSTIRPMLLLLLLQTAAA